MARKGKEFVSDEQKDTLFDLPDDQIIIESIEAQPITWNVAHLVDLMDEGKVNFDTPVQRGYVWNHTKDSLLIRSIIRWWPTSSFYFNRVNGVYEGLEGKQRSNAIYLFVKNGYALRANTPPIKINGEVFQIAGRTFEQLPKKIQNRILSYPLAGHWFDNMSLDDKIEFFILINSGKPMKLVEIFRIRIKSRNVILSLAKHPAMIAGINEINRRKCKDEDIISQLWCMCFNNSTSLLQKDIGPILETMEITEKEKDELICAFDYLEALYKEVKKDKKLFGKITKPTHILSLGYMGFLAHKNAITTDEYIDKALKFFDGEGRTVTTNERYKKAVGAGSAKPEQVKIRMEEIEKALLG